VIKHIGALQARQHLGHLLKEVYDRKTRYVIEHAGKSKSGCDTSKTIAKIAEIVTPIFTLDVIREDPPDNHILECAVEGQADLIFSGNHHLSVSKSTTELRL
jgi:predicted nucleic acid-binding protein